MDLEPDGDEQQVIDATASFLKGELPLERFREADEGRFDAALRKRLAALGWFGMSLPAEAGGLGFTVVEEMLVYREVGRRLGPNAALGVTLAARVAAEAGETGLARALASGGHSVAIAQADPNRPTLRLYDCQGADFALRVGPGEAALVALDGLEVTARACLDRSIVLGDADLSSARVVARARSDATLLSARLLASAMLVGICEATTAMIADYARIRFTFGRPIGSYQAVRHPISEMMTRAYAVRQHLFLAAVTLRDGAPDAAMQIAAVKLLANEAALLNVDANIQLHGGIATTDEHDAHHYMKRAHVVSRLFGGRALTQELNAMAFAA